MRVLTNRSSGKQGYALAQAAVDAGAAVTLVSAPTALTPPVGVRLVPVRTAKEMHVAVMTECIGADALVMAAAVADFRPKVISENKLKKQTGIPQIELESTQDILQAVADLGTSRPKLVIGFAAESRNLVDNALSKAEDEETGYDRRQRYLGF